jgi:hypothetical protein
VALSLSALVLLAAAFPLPAIRNAETGAVVAATLRAPRSYLLFAPFSDALDALSLLSVPQHLALALTLLVSYGCLRGWRQRRARVTLPLIGRELGRAGAMLGALVALETVAARMPRPMAALELESRDRLAIDFHSHTNASKDARRGFTLERNRNWHRDAGFDVAFVTDHYPSHADIRGAVPAAAGAGTVMLFGTERGCGGSHFLILGAPTPAGASCNSAFAPEAGASFPLSEDGAFDEEQTLPSVVAILALPDAFLKDGAVVGGSGMELVDAAPRGLEQLDHGRMPILRSADRSDIALVAGSNNHGWGRTAAAWSVMSIPGWRAMDKGRLEAAILSNLIIRRRTAVEVVERRRVMARSSALMWLTAPDLVLTIARTLSPAERVSWLVWIWLSFGLAALPRRRVRR